MIATAHFERFTAALADRYQVLSEIGRGGMATVYLARDVRHDRDVALKVLGADVAGQMAADRFLGEIRAVAGLNHPHILPLHDSGESEGLLYYVMPYVEGEGLDDRIAREGVLPIDEAVQFVKQVADGLHYAHERGLVHRDIKPGNIMLSAGHAVLMDFGISKAIGESGGMALTSTGHMVGTPLYMAPEQWTDSSSVDGRTDLYSLSCVLYEMLTGQPPYDRHTVHELFAAHATGEVTEISTLRSEIPRPLEAAVTRAMAKEPEQRFSTLEEFSEALSSTTPVALPGRPTGWRAALQPRILAGLGVVGLLAAGVFLGPRLTLGPSTPASPLVPEDRVVVGLVQNQTQDPSLDPVGLMTSDWITEGLLRSGVVDVVPSLAALQAARAVAQLEGEGTVTDPAAALGLEAGAGTVISGNYYQIGDSLAFSLQVTSATDGTVLGSLPSVRGSVDDPSAAINEVRESAMSMLALLLDSRIETPSGAANTPPAFEAYRDFNRGLERYLDSDWQEAYTEFTSSFEKDTSFVLPLLYASFSISNLGETPTADSLVNLAGQRRDDLTDFHRFWLDYLEAQFDGRRDAAFEAIGRAADLAPTSKASYNAGWLANVVNRPQQAVEYLDRLDPERGPMRGWFHYWDQRTEALHRLGRHEEELESALRAREIHPDWIQGLFLEGAARAGLGQTEAVDSIVQVALDWVGQWDWAPGRVAYILGSDLANHGHTEEAERAWERSLEWFESLPPDQASNPGLRSQYADVLLQLERADEAFDVVSTLVRDFPDNSRYRARQAVLAAAKQDPDAVAQLQPFMETADEPFSRGWFDVARAEFAAYQGQADRAVAHLRRAFANGMIHSRHPSPVFAPLKGDPSFDQIWEIRN